MSINSFPPRYQSLPLWLAFCFIFLSGCSQHQNPASFVKFSAGEILLIDRIKVKRQRQFLIPTMSRIAWLVEPVDLKQKSPDVSLHQVLVDNGLYTFSHIFTGVVAVTDAQRLPRDVDFLIKAQIIDARLRAQEMDTNSSQEAKNTPLQPHKRLIPYTALLKLELLDARSQKPLDVAVIQARSGAFGSSQFNHLLRQGLRAYSESITHKTDKYY